jgi:hypothetical protein
MPTTAELDQYIAAHGMWEARLRQVLSTGTSETPVATIRRDDVCEFGKWLKSASPAEQRSPSYRTVKSLHATFHKAAAHVVELATSGRKAEAEKAMGFGGEFFTASAQLTTAMKEWKRAAA